MTWRIRLIRLLMGASSLLLGACASEPKPPKLPVPPGVRQAALPSVPSRVAGVHVRSAFDMNAYMALMLDVVFVHDASLLAELPSTAPAWFEQREKLSLKYAGFIEVLSLQVTVADDTGWLSLTKQQRDAERVLVYANYLSPDGQQMANISVFRCPRLTALASGLVISEAPYERIPRQAFGWDSKWRGRWRREGRDDITCGR